MLHRFGHALQEPAVEIEGTLDSAYICRFRRANAIRWGDCVLGKCGLDGVVYIEWVGAPIEVRIRRTDEGLE